MKFKNVLFVGTGGGNDVFSTILAMLTLKQQGWEWDSCSIAGVLSPFHVHLYLKDHDAYGISQITHTSGRMVWRKNDSFEIGFVDAAVAKLALMDLSLGIEKVLGISLNNGSIGVARSFRELSDIYDYIILVDIGGDILYRGSADTHVLSPMFDALILQGFRDANVPGLIFESGPGTDGELEPEALEIALKAAQAEAYFLPIEALNHWDEIYQKWIAPVRTGRTVPMTIEAYRSDAKHITQTYRARAHIGQERLYANFKQKIKTSLCRKFFPIDPSNIANPFAVRCTNPLDWFLRTQVRQYQTNCEPNLEYYKHDEYLYQFLTPSVLFSESDRLKLLNKGLEDLLYDVCDCALIFPNDWQSIQEQWNEKVKIKEFHGLLAISRI